jgi:hypothetical protein
MKKTMVFLVALCMASTVNAQWGKKIKGNGNMVTEERTTGSYEGVAVSGWFDVELTDGKEGALTIRGEENLLEYIITEVKDGDLVIRVEKGVQIQPSSWKNGGSVLITVPVESINSVSLSGSGDIVGKTKLQATNFSTSMSGSGDITLDVDAESMEASMSGSGDISLSGNAKNLDVRISGSGDVNAFDMEVDTVDATVSGSADIEVTVNEMLKARVSGSGNITYKGDPKKIDSKSSGSGDITKA